MSKSLEAFERIESVLLRCDEHYDSSEVEAIKQDLEIFNIIKQLFIHNKKYLGVQKSLNSFKALVNCGEITQKQYDKLKVWLENDK